MAKDKRKKKTAREEEPPMPDSVEAALNEVPDDPAEEAPADAPPKRGPGRPKGSKNRKAGIEQCPPEIIRAGRSLFRSIAAPEMTPEIRAEAAEAAEVMFGYYVEVRFPGDAKWLPEAGLGCALGGYGIVTLRAKREDARKEAAGTAGPAEGQAA